MNTAQEELEIREAIREAKKLQQHVHATAQELPPEAKTLRDKMCAAADRTVLNLELALDAWLRDNNAQN